MFGLLWEWSRRVWVPICHIAPFSGGVKTAFSRCGWGLRHGSAVAYLLVVQEMRVGGACFTSFSKTKVNGIRNSGRTDRGENPRCPLARARSQRYGSRR